MRKFKTNAFGLILSVLFLSGIQNTYAQLSPTNVETLVNTTTTTGSQKNCAISMDTLGRYVVVWEGPDASGLGIYGKIYNADHTVRVAEFQINTGGTDFDLYDQRFPDVAMNPDGTWCVVWQSAEDQGFNPSFGTYETEGWDVYRRIYNVDGAATSPRSRVNSSQTGNQMLPAVAAGDGFFVATFASEVAGENESEIYGRPFLLNGVNVNAAQLIHSVTGSHLTHPDVAMTPTNEYTFTWQADSLDGDRNGIYYASYNNSYLQVTSPTLVNTTTAGNQQEPGIAVDENGEFIIVWSSFNQDGDHYGIYGQRFSGPGTSSGGEIAITSNTTGSQDHAAVSLTREGTRFVFTWTDDVADGSKSGIYGRSMDSTGTFLESDYLINTTTSDYQSFSNVAQGLGSTEAVFAWQSGVRDGITAQTDASSYGIYSQAFTAVDNIAPIAVCQNINVYLDASGNASIVPADIDGGSSDNVGIVNMTVNSSTFTCSNLGANTVLLTVFDAAGLNDNCNATVTVLDTISPVITCVANISIECDEDQSPANTGSSSATDNCDASPTISFSDAVSPGICSNASIITRTWTATDAQGNVSTCAQTITIDDNTPPTASNLTALNVECIGDVPAPNVLFVNDESDNCTASPIVAFVSDVSDGLSCPETITRTFSVTDDCSNSINVTQIITVHDITPPTASNAVTINVDCIADVPSPNILLVNDESDNCTAAPTVAFVSDVSDGLSCPETITRTFSVTDDCSNSITVTQTIIVNDLTPPTASNLAPINVECIGDVPTANILAVTDEADNCTTSPVVAFVSDVSNGMSCPQTITRTYSVTDDCSNSILVTQIITVDDITPPTASNPAPISVECIGDVPAPNILAVTDAADNCIASPFVTFVSDVSDGLSCPQTITRTYSIGDGCSNSITVTQLITVDDITPPTASNPIAINVECIGDVPAPNILDVTDEADNCIASPFVTFVSDVSDGLSCPETITRTYSVGDGCSNSITVTQTITVNDITPPTASNPVALSFDCIGDVTAADILVVTDEADNCTASPIVAFVSDVSDGLTCPETITRTFSVTDDCSNASLVTQTITVNDVTAPTASNLAPISVECIGDVPSANVLDIMDEADNCTTSPVVAFVSDVSDGLSCPETITRTYSVTDDCANTINVTQTITVNDITAPTASNPAPISVECSGDVPVADILVVSDEADNCSTSPVVAFVSDVSDGLSCPETITRTYSITDDCSNSITVTQTIFVDDITSPVEDVANLPEVSEGCSISPTAPTATDNCDGILTGVPDVTFPITTVGTTVVTWTYTDLCGNTTSQTQNAVVTAVDVTASLQTDQVTVTTNNSNGTYQWIDCNNGNTIIPGETNQSYVATSNGSYAVIITENGCTDTSDCIVVDQVSIDEISIESLIIYPNPSSNGIFKYSSEGIIKDVKAYDMQGRKVTISLDLENKIIDGSGLARAKYMLVFELENGSLIRKEIIVLRDY